MKRFLSLLLALTLALPLGSTALALDRPYILFDSLVKDAISNELLPGDADAADIMTRGSFSQFLWRAMDRPPLLEGEGQYPDVEPEHKNYHAILALRSHGAYEGIPLERFEPDAAATREFALCVLANVLGMADEGDPWDVMEDSEDLSDWARPVLSAYGLMELTIMLNAESGIEDITKIYPQEPLLTGEAAFLLSYFYSRGGCGGSYDYDDTWINFTHDTSAEPEGEITRGEFAYMLSHWAVDSGMDLESGGSNFPFVDVPQDAYYKDAVALLYEMGIIKGCGDSMFCPDAPMTREMMAVMLYRALEQFAVGPLDGPFYSDEESISPWALSAYRESLIVELTHYFNDIWASEPPDAALPQEVLTRRQAGIVIASLFELGLMWRDIS